MEEVEFLAKAVRHKRFQIIEAITLTRSIYRDDFDVSGKLVIRAFHKYIFLPPSDL